jgi:type IV fimbrial biogenesis protein FimT
MDVKQRGVTLVELMITITVLGVALAIAIPSYTNVRNKRAVTNAAEQVSALLSTARSEAVRRNTTVTVTLNRTFTSWCAGMADNTTATCDCANPAAANFCDLDDIDASLTTDDTIYLLKSADFELIGMPLVYGAGASQVTPLRLTFDPVRGLLSNANAQGGRVLLTSVNNKYSLQVMMGVNGRVRVCNPTSGKEVPGFSNCS